MIDDLAPPPAPVAPAPAPAPTAPVAPLPVPTIHESAVETATRVARDRIASLGTALPSDVPGPGERASRVPNRAPDGTFSTDRFKEVGADVPTGEEPPPSAAGEGPPAAGPAAGRAIGAEREDQGVPSAALPQAGAEAAEGDGAVEGDDEDPALVVALPGRRPDDPAYEITVDTPETAERMRQLTNAAMRGDQAREFVAQQMAQIDATHDAMTLDPAGYLLDTFRDQPQVVEHIALALLSQPGVWERVGARVLNWDDPDKYELDAAKVTAEQYRMRDELRTVAERRQVVADNLRDVQGTVQRMVPATLAAAQQASFFQDALRDLKDYADRHRLVTLDPRDIPLILASRVQSYGLDPLDAARAIARPNGNGTGSRTAPPAPTSPAASRTPPAPKSGKQFVASAQRRQRAASVAPPGAGAPSNAPTPPADQSIAERVAWHRKQMQFGKKPL